MARRPYAELVGFAERIAAMLVRAHWASRSSRTKCSSMPRRPSSKSISTSRSIFAKQNVYRRLGEVSPVVRTLAQEQFDDYVKRVRIFVHPRIAAAARKLPDLANDSRAIGRRQFASCSSLSSRSARRRCVPYARQSAGAVGWPSIGRGSRATSPFGESTRRNSAISAAACCSLSTPCRDQNLGERAFAIGLNHEQPHQVVARHQPHLDRQVAESHVGRFALGAQHVEDVPRRDNPFFQRQLPDRRQRFELGLQAQRPTARPR